MPSDLPKVLGEVSPQADPSYAGWPQRMQRAVFPWGFIIRPFMCK